MRARFLCFRPPKKPETIWLHSFSAGRIYDNAYLLASLPVPRRDKPKALVLAARRRALDAAGPKATISV